MRSFSSLVLRASGVVLTAVVATGCGLLGPADAQRDAASGEITAGTDADVFSLRLGDCLDFDLSGTEPEEVTSLPTVPCGEPHNAEIYAVTDLPDGEYPGDDAALTAGDDCCWDQYESFVGLAWVDSTLDYTFYVPTEMSWRTKGDRQVQCVLVDYMGGVTGTMSGVQR